MYDEHYGLTGRPFQLTPDPKFWFETGTHRKAMAYLGYGLAQGEGFIVVTGDIGAGKTTLVGHLMDTIDHQRLNAIRLVSTADTGFFYVTKKNTRNITEKLVKKKYDPVARKHVEFKEGKIK